LKENPAVRDKIDAALRQKLGLTAGTAAVA
jgi:hypothetical protein